MNRITDTSDITHSCATCQHPSILHSRGWCAVTETPWDGGRGKQCACNFYVEPRQAEVCTECGERIPDDEAVMHYHPGTVIE